MEIASVLVADGDDAFCAAITALVARAGLAVRRARTGDDALRLAAIQRPSVVVLDVALRGPSGFETCRELREIFGEGLPILFVSADRTEPTDRVAGLMRPVATSTGMPSPCERVIAARVLGLSSASRPTRVRSKSDAKARTDFGKAGGRISRRRSPAPRTRRRLRSAGR